jgi:peptide/nickel transport system substrate-binding protein
MQSRLLAVGVAFLFSACGDRAEKSGPQDSRGRTALDGGTVVIAYDHAIPTLGVLHTADGMAGQVQRDVLFMPLIKLDAAQEPLPWLAERWDTVRFSPDSLELTFRLREDVTWHDGVPTTAEDVRFTFDRIMDPRTGAIPRRLFSLYSRQVDVPDRRTIRFRVRASGGFLNVWSNVPPLPKHLLREVPPEMLASHPFGREPVGNGPFRFLRRTPNEEWVFDANPDFPTALGGTPHLDRVVIRTIPDPSARLTELLVGRVHVSHVFAPQIEQVRTAPGVQLLEFVTPRGNDRR